MTYSLFPGREPPEDDSDGRYGQDSQQWRSYAEACARLDRDQILAANRAKQDRLRAKLEAGELDTADPVRRWFHSLAEGERHGERELAEVGSRAYEIDELEEGDPHAVLAWLETHRGNLPGGNLTGAQALRRLRDCPLHIEIRHGRL